MAELIRIRGARQNNLRGIDLELPLGELIVVTGVSGSGKSSLAFDTLYAEGQRRYVETFSPYARQFLERMDSPDVERIEGIPPAIAIDQVNPVRTSRSTVGTMTELNDHLKLLFARAARPFCPQCGREVRRRHPEDIADELLEANADGAPILISFDIFVPEGWAEAEVRGFLAQQGYTRALSRQGARLSVVQDRLRLSPRNRSRLIEDLEAALKRGRGELGIHWLDEARQPIAERRYSSHLACPDCNRTYRAPAPSQFSFNSPLGACEHCRGFGRVMGIDYGLVIPDEGKSLAEGAIRPWQSGHSRECQADLERAARAKGVPMDVPWAELSEADRRWVIEGDGTWETGGWYGIRGFFQWLESKSYKMHVRVLLSRYRSYDTCPACLGARLKPQSLDWRLGSAEDANAISPPGKRFRPAHVTLSDVDFQALPGLNLHDLMRLPVERLRRFFGHLTLPRALNETTGLLMTEIRSRLGYLCEVGLGYLDLDRQSRTLSGGEAQRINLTTALGTSLVNTLFVLDEPTVGLHARDIDRIVGILKRLRDAGNTLVVVEHDPQVINAADRIVDIGPGPGEQGGRIVFEGPPSRLHRCRASLTRAYLSGERQAVSERAADPPDAATRWLTVLGACAHNLKAIDVRFPLKRMTCITGVSGSGKSTLVNDVLYRALRKRLGRPVDPPGAHRGLEGWEAIDNVVMVDQSPIGKTTRSNPASYVGAFDAIRRRFAAAPMARQRGYTVGTFSFNAGNGRCPTCGGNGFEHVEMQFLSDVYLRCPDCDGRRYRPEVLEIKLSSPSGGRGRSIADVLDMTVTETLSFFGGEEDIERALSPLVAVGLGYLRLGQPVPTLSGGEAQRLKLAAHLASPRAGGNGTLFLFDEPTTGLHMDDVATLLRAFAELRDAGHTLVIIEHNLDVIRAADWVIDLGPEGGEAGGRICFEGTTAALAAGAQGHTGRALRDAGRRMPVSLDRVAEAAPPGGPPAIRIHHAREHNLKNVEVQIPRNRFTAITGVSGSGKSTIAFDILFAEGQRRYLESLNAYARQFVQPAARPDVDAVLGIPPTVAIEQRTSRGGWRSTVGTVTDIYHFLRLLFARLGVQHCPDCDLPIEAQDTEAIVARLLREHRGQSVTLLAPLVRSRKGYYTELAKWASGRGFGRLRVDAVLTPTSPWPRLDRYREHDIELPLGTLEVVPGHERELRELLQAALDYGDGTVHLVPADGQHPVDGAQAKILSTERACPGCGRSFPELDPRLFSFNSKHGWCSSCTGTGLARTRDETEQETPETIEICQDCRGRRLRPEARTVRYRGWTIDALTNLAVSGLLDTLSSLRAQGREAAIAEPLLAEVTSRLRFLMEVGLGYLSLDRTAPTLSGGEAQRLRLAAQLGSNLQGVCYILDEPTIGLHPRDNRMLLGTLCRLRDLGNTVVVVEHDEETIRFADHIVDLGPGAGRLGGEVVAAGDLGQLLASERSVTGRQLAARESSEWCRLRPDPDDDPDQRWLTVTGVRRRNIEDLDVRLPLGRMTCVTGVSGSGKSTLVREVLEFELRRRLAARQRHRPEPVLERCQDLTGSERIVRVMEVDQTPIGKTPRSCPATYIGIMDPIRRLFAGTEEARSRGYGAGRFSFNTPEGRCPACAGQGVQRIEMYFLPDVEVTCEDCGGRRFTAETLAVTYRGHNIGEVLSMSVDEAVTVFSAHRRVHRALVLLQQVGLGYLTLGQPSPTLSGGEAQRIKLVSELAKAGAGDRGGVLYLLDEPTVGLHMADVGRLVEVLHQLTQAEHSVVVIEHNLDLIAQSDWIIDLGPEGGAAGGRLVAQGPPKRIAEAAGSHTGQFLGSHPCFRRGFEVTPRSGTGQEA